MKKSLSLGASILLLACTPITVLALENDIDPLAGTTSGLCINLTQDMRITSRDSATGGQVSDLQFILQSRGYLQSEPTGYFGNLTLAAVKRFQVQNGINPSGFVGLLTRTRINSASCNITDTIINVNTNTNTNNNTNVINVVNRNADNFGAIRFTAPESGSFQVVASLSPILVGPLSQDSDLHIVKNNDEVYTKNYAANENGNYSQPIQMNSGDTLDFLVGKGPDGRSWGSGLVIKLVITGNGKTYDLSTGFPDTMNPKGQWTIGYKPVLKGGFVPFVNTYMVPDDNGVLVKSWSVSRTEQPSIYWNNGSASIIANSGASVFPTGSVWFVGGIEGVTLSNPIPTPTPYYYPTPSPTPTTYVSPSPTPSHSPSYSPSPTPYPTASPVVSPTLFNAYFPRTDSVFDSSVSSSIILLWSKYVGDFDHYEVVAGNSILNVEARISDQPIDARSNGYRIDVSKLRKVIESVSGKIGTTGGYYLKVTAIKGDKVGGQIVGVAKSRSFDLPAVNPSPSPTPTPYVSPTPSPTPIKTPSY